MKASLLLLLGLCACDWTGSAFFNGIPMQGDRSGDVHVYLAVDGLSAPVVRAARERGAFPGPRWQQARLVTMFPATSDASWTRLLHTAKIPGYELEYYDPHKAVMVNPGLPGVARHITPAFSEALDFEAPYLRAFDYRSNGYTNGLEAYADTWVSLGDTLDNLFYQLDGASQTGDVFSAYLLEQDVLGHTATIDDCTRMLLMLEARIERFRAAHPDRRFHFTLLSDHGMDFTGIPPGRLLDFRTELPKAGVEVVESLQGRDPRAGVYAIPVVHTRVTYLAIHTDELLTAEVARRASTLEAVDFTAGRLPPAPDGAATYGIWSGGELVARFEYHPADSSYVLSGDFERFGIRAGAMTDAEVFSASSLSRYPDLLYRLRTSLTDVGVDYPAQVLVSFRTGYGSVGFRPPLGVGDFSGGSHGAADELSAGVLLSEERELPPAVRGDGFLMLFPRLAAHLRERGLELIDGDPDAARVNP